MGKKLFGNISVKTDYVHTYPKAKPPRSIFNWIHPGTWFQKSVFFGQRIHRSLWMVGPNAQDLRFHQKKTSLCGRGLSELILATVRPWEMEGAACLILCLFVLWGGIRKHPETGAGSKWKPYLGYEGSCFVANHFSTLKCISLPLCSCSATMNIDPTSLPSPPLYTNIPLSQRDNPKMTS